jgi:hypothetical protein
MEVVISLFEIVYLYLPGGNEENNEKISTKMIGLRAEIRAEEFCKYVLTFQRYRLPPSV